MKRSDRRLNPRYFSLLSVVVLSLLLTEGGGNAADPSANYPSKPIEYVVYSAPGGGNAIFAQVVSDIVKNEKILSQPIVVVHKTGAGGGIAMAYVFERNSNPHIVFAVPSCAFIMTTLIEKLPYTLHKSFTPIVNMSADGNVLVVRSDSPFKTAEDIVAEAKKRPNELIQGGSSFTAPATMMGQYIQKRKGVKWKFISFKNEAEALLNILGGTVQFAFVTPELPLDYVRTGKMRVLLAGALNRYSQYRDVPTVKEAGMGEPLLIYRGIMGPPNMPDYAVKKLEAVFKKVANSDRFKKYGEDSMMQPAWMSSDEYRNHLMKEQAGWTERLSELGLLKK